MNQKLLGIGVGLALLLGWGCAGTRYKTAEVYSNRGPVEVPPEPTLTQTQVLTRAQTAPVTPVDGPNWQRLFDGQSLAGWRIPDFGGTRVEARTGLIYLEAGKPFNGISYTNPAPKEDYEISLDAMRVSGSDFFCGLTFPVRDSFCSLIVGGWGGSLVGLSSLDGSDASENETTQNISFETGKWYRIRLRVTSRKIEAWIEQKKVVNVTTTGRKIGLRFGEIELSKPLGITCWDTAAAVREIQIRPIATPDSPTTE